ncbi:hypothetical protein, conserved [Trypanosoma brucei gambiense DAL972]|uniref:Inosine triphosphate pyrophosphatase n=2 Tax=Trypanosoma brucei TaxID=5691 RepID=D0A4D0_TRYB9|nr:hypothetical protein, conserved [Trypanosoma brucei gambiense DAL972]CBH16124.1 hypothetical protein, conserved [Trypanosoma brucei gambiense DAL972]|eukprot:XP_011778388.1 hypothetical protein, conserved [Trypanosoma brucei gambiense DAL972]
MFLSLVGDALQFPHVLFRMFFAQRMLFPLACPPPKSVIKFCVFLTVHRFFSTPSTLITKVCSAVRIISGGEGGAENGDYFRKSLNIMTDASKTTKSVENANIPTLTFVTGNAGKLREVQACLGGYVTTESVKLDLPEIQASSVSQVSREKALLAYERLKKPVLVEDTGLSFEALGGMPGPYVRWFLDAVGPIGLAKMLNGFESRSAQVDCVFTYCASPGEVLQFIGSSRGSISMVPRGEGGFGFDTIFMPDDGNGQTFAEMSASTKNTISHRARALVEVRKHFENSK